MSRRAVAVAASFALLAPCIVSPALAECTQLAFSVNDYGKEGPTNDAKNLLDGYIKKWTSERGIKTYTVGPKDVTCELFLNFIVFDEHTCKASAKVCWNGPMPAEPGSASANAGGAGAATSAAGGDAKKSAARPAQTKAAPASISIATGSVAPVVAKAPVTKAAPVAKSPAKATATKAPVADPAAAPAALPVARDPAPNQE
jgi:hypothetical protein